MRVMWTRGIRRKDGIGMRGNKRLICVYVAFVLLGAFAGAASTGTIYVPDNYTKIQWAVDNATAGDTIIVRPGTYTENIDVNKFVEIRSYSQNTSDTIVEAFNSNDHVFYVTADNVTIKGFKVTGAGSSKAGICLYNSNNSRIENVNASNNWCGIHLHYSYNNTNGTGFSQTCTDADGDGICDNAYTLATNNTDYLPLATPPLIQNVTTCGVINSPGLYILQNDIINSASTACIKITTSDVIFDGNGDVIDGVDGTDSYGIYVYNSTQTLTNITVINVTASDWNIGIFFKNVNDSKIENVTATSSDNSGSSLYDAGIRLQDTANITISSGTIYDNGDGIWLENSHDIAVRESEIYNNTGAGGEYNDGIRFNDVVHDVLIENSIIHSNDYGVDIDSDNDTLAYNVTIRNNQIYNNDYEGVVVDYGDTVNIKDNSICNNDGYGIYLAYDNEVSGVIIENNDISENHYGIYTYYEINNASIVNNTISNNVYDGMHFEDNVNDSIIRDNRIINNDDGIAFCACASCIIYNTSIANNNVSANSEDGIYVVFRVNDSAFKDNIITNNGDSGIELDHWVYNTSIINNTVTNNSDGIQITNGNNVSIINDTIVSNQDVGLNLSIDNSLIRGNRIENNTYGMGLASTSNLIYNNYFNNTNNTYFYNTYQNSWNTTKQQGKNIVGGPYLAGNYWAYPNGTGFSQTCADADGDGICDSAYTLATNNTDYLPLTTPPLTQNVTTCGVINSPGIYILQNDIINSTSDTCIKIISSDVVFDGNGHTIDGVGKSQSIGILIDATKSRIDNVTIINTTLTQWEEGIAGFGNMSNISIINSIIHSGDGGIVFGGEEFGSLVYFDDISIVNTSAFNNTLVGIFGFGAFDNLYISDSEFYENGFNTTLCGQNPIFCGGIVLPSNFNSSGLVIENSRIYHNNFAGTLILGNFSGIQISNNDVFENGYLCQGENCLIEESVLIGGGITLIGYSSTDGDYFRNITDVTISNNRIFNNTNVSPDIYVSGINLFLVNNSIISDNTITNNTIGIFASAVWSITTRANQISDNYVGFLSEGGGIWDSVITANWIRDNQWGVGLWAINSTVYNNYFNNTVNAIERDGSSIRWNITKQEGTNIVGGAYLGGNYWSDYIGYDTDEDGLGDTPYNITNSSGNVVAQDYHPLITNFTPAAENLNTGKKYMGIQGAIDEASPYDTIKIFPGIYRTNLIINKPIILSGDPIIDASGGIGIRIMANDTFVEHLIVFNASTAILAYNSTSLLTNITLNNCTAYNSTNGTVFIEVINSKINSSTSFNDSGYGIALIESHNNTLTNVTVEKNNYGMYLFKSNSNVLNGSYVRYNNYGIFLNVSQTNTITNFTITHNNYGIYFHSLQEPSTNNIIYNNLFNNTNNVYFSGAIHPNKWNVTKQVGTNIIGGLYLGGNFWAKPDGTGFSQTCTDSDADGICDSPYTISTNNTDYLPLTRYTPKPPKIAKVPVESKISITILIALLILVLIVRSNHGS